MDECDMAQRQSEQSLARAIARVKARRPGNTAHIPIHCRDCGAKIPEKRRAAIPGCSRCVACQAEYERNGMR